MGIRGGLSKCHSGQNTILYSIREYCVLTLVSDVDTMSVRNFLRYIFSAGIHFIERATLFVCVYIAIK